MVRECCSSGFATSKSFLNVLVNSFPQFVSEAITFPQSTACLRAPSPLATTPNPQRRHLPPNSLQLCFDSQNVQAVRASKTPQIRENRTKKSTQTIPKIHCSPCLCLNQNHPNPQNPLKKLPNPTPKNKKSTGYLRESVTASCTDFRRPSLPALSTSLRYPWITPPKCVPNPENVDSEDLAHCANSRERARDTTPRYCSK